MKMNEKKTIIFLLWILLNFLVAQNVFAEGSSLVPVNSLCPSKSMHIPHSYLSSHHFNSLLANPKSFSTCSLSLLKSPLSTIVNAATTTAPAPVMAIGTSASALQQLLNKTVTNVTQNINPDTLLVSTELTKENCQPTDTISSLDSFKSPQYHKSPLYANLPEEFFAWLDQALYFDKNYLEKGILTHNLNDLLVEFYNWQKDLTYTVSVNKNVQVFGSKETRNYNPITASFIESFNKLSSSDEEYQKKIKTYYYENPIYKGLLLGDKTPELTFKEILSSFVKFNRFTVGKGIDKTIDKGEIEERFNLYNKLLIKKPEKLAEKVTTHTSGYSDDEGYLDSGFTSFSRIPQVADEFARGKCFYFSTYGKPQTMITIESRDRKMGAIHGDVKTNLWNKPSKYSEYTNDLDDNMTNEEEVSIHTGVDPESVDRVVVNNFDDYTVDGTIKTIKITKRIEAKRISYNQIEVTEKFYAPNTIMDMDEDKDGPRATPTSTHKSIYIIDAKTGTIARPSIQDSRIEQEQKWLAN